MEIKTKNAISRIKVSNLEINRVYLVYNSASYSNQILITDVDKNGILISNWYNDKNGICLLTISLNDEINLIGQIYDFDIVNIELN